jgi:DNA-binding MarR family transcriptional regulator
MTSDYLILLSDSNTRKVFELVAKKKKARFKDIQGFLELDKNAVSQILNRLRLANLIEEVPSSIEEFRTYIVTSEGLSAVRQLRRLAW